jgi:hypothetical protein
MFIRQMQTGWDPDVTVDTYTKLGIYRGIDLGELSNAVSWMLRAELRNLQLNDSVVHAEEPGTLSYALKRLPVDFLDAAAFEVGNNPTARIDWLARRVVGDLAEILREHTKGMLIILVPDKIELLHLGEYEEVHWQDEGGNPPVIVRTHLDNSKYGYPVLKGMTFAVPYQRTRFSDKLWIEEQGRMYYGIGTYSMPW